MEDQLGSGMGIAAAFLILAVFGAIVGWIASLVIRGTGLGLVGDIVLGIAGAVFGGWLFNILGIHIDGIIGAGTRAAVRAEQRRLGMPADAWPTPELLRAL